MCYYIELYLQKKEFLTYLNDKGWDGLVNEMHVAPFTVLDIAWTNKLNITDSGVYCMRHMETYFGDVGSDWDPGFKHNKITNVNQLRDLYCEAFFENQYNEMGAKNGKVKI